MRRQNQRAVNAAAPAPAPGEHTAEVLGGTLGLSATEIEQLRADGVV